MRQRLYVTLPDGDRFTCFDVKSAKDKACYLLHTAFSVQTLLRGGVFSAKREYKIVWDADKAEHVAVLQREKNERPIKTDKKLFT